MTLDDYTDIALKAGIRPDRDPEALARHFAEVAGLRAPLSNEALPTALESFGCVTEYAAPLGRDKAGFWERRPDGTYSIFIKRHRPCPRATFVEAHEVGEIIGRIARERLPAWEGPQPGTRDEERFANRFAGELVSPMADFFPRFRDSGLSIAAMVEYYNQSEHVVARQAKMVAQHICPLMILVCPIVRPEVNDILESRAREVPTALVQIFDAQFSSAFHALYTVRGLRRRPRPGDYRSVSNDLLATLNQRRATWIQRLPQSDLLDSYDLSAYVEVRQNSRKKAEELVITFVRHQDGHHFERRATAEDAIVVPECGSVFGRFELTRKAYLYEARRLKGGESLNVTRDAVQLALEDWQTEVRLHIDTAANGPLFSGITGAGVADPEADAALREALSALIAA